MVGLATLTANRNVQLPDEVAKRFQPTDRFMVWVDDDTVVLKRIKPSVTTIVEQAPTGEPLSLEESNDIVHEVRRQRRLIIFLPTSLVSPEC